MSAAVGRVRDAVETLADLLPFLLNDFTDPEARDLAETLQDVREAREALQQIERELETATARAMLGDYAESPTLRVERTRAAERKTWDHDAWQRDARAKILQAHGLKGAQVVITADGEELPASEIGAALAELQRMHGAAGPRLTELRGVGLDPDDYCERRPGTWRVKVTRMADEGARDDSVA